MIFTAINETYKHQNKLFMNSTQTINKHFLLAITPLPTLITFYYRTWQQVILTVIKAMHTLNAHGKIWNEQVEKSRETPTVLQST